MAAIQLSSAAILQVEQALQKAIMQSSQATALTKDQLLMFSRIVDATAVRLMRTIATCLALPAQGRLLDSTSEHASAQPIRMYLKALPEPPIDAEVRELQSQVAAASQQVAQLRATVPSQLAQELSEHLLHCRPALISPDDHQPAALEDAAAGNEPAINLASGPAMVTGAGDSLSLTAACGAACLSPAPAALQSMYRDAVHRMPALRAKLEEAVERMDRVVQAIERDVDPTSPYNPAFMRIADDDGNAADALSPALQQALQSGKVVTRRPLGKDVNPVPYAT